MININQIIWALILFMSGTLAIIESGFFYISLKNMQKSRIKTGLWLMFVASLITILFTCVLAYFGFMKIQLKEIFLPILTFLFLIISIFWIIGLKKIIEGVQRINTK